MALIDHDDQGLPVLLAEPRRRELEEPRTEIVTPDSTSGPAEWGRYHDAVREASRSFDNPEEGDIQLFLNARARNPERVDTGAFHEAVRRQRMADLVDICDHHMRRDGSLPRGSRHIRTQAPKGYLRRSLRNSTPEDLAHLRHRLNAIGHSDDRVSDFLSNRAGDDLWDQASVYEVTASEGEFEGLIFDSSDSDSTPSDVSDQVASEIVDGLAEALKDFKPVINIYVTSNKEEK